MYPVQPPEAVGIHFSWRPNVPILLDRRNEAIHPIIYLIEMRRLMISYVDRFLAKSSPELGNVSYRRMVERPEKIFIKRDRPLHQPDLDAISHELVLALQVLFLNAVIQLSVFLLQNEHGASIRRGLR